MKVSEQWLREWVNPNIDTAQLAEQLTMAGLEVDSVTPAAEDFTNVVVGEVVSCTKHPDASRLNCCKVNVGNNTELDIVCGGVNVREGLKVAVATVGAVLPNGMEIKKAKLRGAPSEGMICSSDELGLGESAVDHGILELPVDAPVGEDFRAYLQLDDNVFDIELTPNRGDCTSIKGVARDVGVLNELPVNGPVIKPVNPTIQDVFPVTINDEKACPRYVGRVIRGIRKAAVTPMWMQEKLRRAGLRCIHLVVDVCNVVMIELGQPMHGFDLETLSKGVTVRASEKNETIELLDDTKVTLKVGTLVIADDQGPQAIAGIMGGQKSGVSDNTENVFLESAYFDPIAVRLNARAHGLQSDSSYRFERSVDWQLQVDAIERATHLLVEIAGGEVGPIIEAQSEKQLPKPTQITLRFNQIERLLGLEIDKPRVENILTALGCTVSAEKNAWMVTVPSFRFDITQEVDLIEELARIHGYHNIPVRHLKAEMVMPEHQEAKIEVSRLAHVLIDRGYYEAITYSFTDQALQSQLEPDVEAIALDNPLTSEMGVMRTSVWSGLLQALVHNHNRQIPRVRLFETGLCFIPAKNELQQTPKLAMLAAGSAAPLQWSEESRPVDFFDVKRDIQVMITLTQQPAQFEWARGAHPALHPGQTAELRFAGKPVGVLGVLHPTLVEQFGLSSAPVLFECDLNALTGAALPVFEKISKFPGVRRDLALIIEQSLQSGDLVEKIQQRAGQMLSNIEIFDIYQGEGIEKGKKSVALGLTFQNPSRTLVDDEINEVIQRVVSTLENECNAKLRA